MTKNQNYSSPNQKDVSLSAEAQYSFFCRGRAQNLAGQWGASVAIVAMAWNMAHQPTLIAYLIVNQFLVLLTGIAFFSRWTNQRLTYDGLPKFVVEMGIIRQTFLGSLFWLNLEAAQNVTFVLAVLIAMCACLLGSIVTLGPLKRLAMPSMTCLLLPSALACLYVGHIAIGCAVLFFIFVVALRGAKQVNLAYAELIRLREESSIAAEQQEQNNDKLKLVNESLEKEIERRSIIEADRAKLQEELVEASRQAGKAEVATGVLHNVGNVMNSVTVTASILKDDLRERLLDRLDSSIELLSQHGDDLPAFFESDARARHFVPFMKQLSNQTEEMVNDFDKLLLHIEHVNDVVTAQQSFATGSQFTIDVDPASIVESAIQIVDDRYREHGIKLETTIESEGKIRIDRPKLLQVLVNILQNAANSISDSEREEKVVSLHLQKTDGLLKIAITDTGVGISPENIDRIFQHGFTTRKDRGGHGFGLHHSVNTIKELGGKLTANSSGKMQGATFTITLPWIAPTADIDSNSSEVRRSIVVSTTGQGSKTFQAAQESQC